MEWLSIFDSELFVFVLTAIGFYIAFNFSITRKIDKLSIQLTGVHQQLHKLSNNYEKLSDQYIELSNRVSKLEAKIE